MKRNYNPSMIKILESEHQRLFEIYTEIKKLLEENADFSIIVDKLDSLKVLLTIHVDFENQFLYSYLEDRYSNKKDKLTFIEKADKDMQKIVDVALNFIEECSNYELYSKKRMKFIEEFNAIGDILIERISFEENQLYPLYIQ